jgi:hypothetical protein
MKVIVYEGQLYPVALISSSVSKVDDTVEIPDSIVRKYVDAYEAFLDAQEEVRGFQREQEVHDDDRVFRYRS